MFDTPHQQKVINLQKDALIQSLEGANLWLIFCVVVKSQTRHSCYYINQEQKLNATFTSKYYLSAICPNQR